MPNRDDMIRQLSQQDPTLGMYWILDDNGEPRLAENVLEWAKWLEENSGQNSHRRTVARTVIDPPPGVSNMVSRVVWTYFLGLDARLTVPAPKPGEPILWETATGLFRVHARYSSKEDAAKGHELVVARFRSGQELNDE